VQSWFQLTRRSLLSALRVIVDDILVRQTGESPLVAPSRNDRHVDDSHLVTLVAAILVDDNGDHDDRTQDYLL